jgi:hypothetical protein
MPVSMTTSFDDEPLATQQPRPPFPATFASNDEFGTGEYPPSKDAPKSKRSRENSEDKCNFDHQEDDVCNGSQTDFHSEYETDSSDFSPQHKRRKTSIPHCEYHCPDMQEKFNGPYAHAVVTSCQYKQSTPKKIRFHKLYRDIEDASACVARWVWRQYCKYEDGDEEEALEILERRGPVEERGWYTPRDWKGMEFGAWVQSMPLE